MKTQITTNQKVMGGGISEPISTHIALIRFSNYARRYWKREPSHLTQEQRMIGAKVLQDIFAFQQKEVAGIMKVSRITAHKDKNSADLYYERMADFQQKCKKLEDYIRYFSKYLTTV